jgi:ribonuclease BN (tRNA processing enzyme)
MDDGKVFAFLTDNENEDGIPTGLKNHVKNADLLIIDSQYRRSTYDNGQCGFGHGTADYAVKVALNCGVKRLGLSHHDPSSTDQDIKEILQEAVAHRNSMDSESKLEIFACADYMEIKV